MDIKHIDDMQLTIKQEPGEPLPKRLLATGIFTMLLGIAAIFLPFVATLTIQVMIAAVLIAAAFTHLVHAFQAPHPKGVALRFLAGVIYGIFGFMLLAFPLKGALTLTVLLALLFMISGTFKIAHSLVIRPLSSWTWLLFNGIVSVLLGIFIWLGLPEAANWVIGLLVGIELVFSGWAMTMYARAVRHVDPHEQ